MGFQHDVAYGELKYLPRRTASDQILCNKASSKYVINKRIFLNVSISYHVSTIFLVNMQNLFL